MDLMILETSGEFCRPYIFDSICCLSASKDRVPVQPRLLSWNDGHFRQRVERPTGIWDYWSSDWRSLEVRCDWDQGWHALSSKGWKLKRSWNTTGRQRTAPRGVCHLCLAGTQNTPFEDTSEGAHWVQTIGVQAPWDTMPNIVRLLPYPKSHPGSFLQPDLWHSIHLGVGKSFIASTLQIALEVVPATNNEDRFEWLRNHYHSWCRSVKVSSHISKISAYLVSYGDGPGRRVTGLRVRWEQIWRDGWYHCSMIFQLILTIFFPDARRLPNSWMLRWLFSTMHLCFWKGLSVAMSLSGVRFLWRRILLLLLNVFICGAHIYCLCFQRSMLFSIPGWLWKMKVLPTGTEWTRWLLAAS